MNTVTHSNNFLRVGLWSFKLLLHHVQQEELQADKGQNALFSFYKNLEQCHLQQIFQNLLGRKRPEDMFYFVTTGNL